MSRDGFGTDINYLVNNYTLVSYLNWIVETVIDPNTYYIYFIYHTHISFESWIQSGQDIV